MHFPHFKYSKLIFWILVAFILFLTFSCSDAKLIQRIHKRSPHLFENIIDTVIVNDTIEVSIPEDKAETLVPYDRLRDTFYIDTGRLHIKIVRVPTDDNPLNDKLFIQGIADSVKKSIPITLKVPVKKYVVPKPKKRIDWFNWQSILNSVLLVFNIFYIFLLTRHKPH